ncbi:uncharacterized protein C4orf22 homolog [Orussus abietinus]|uniref:uncharacterized protein C4orf22 homolog n=1 Tax=Orussus abietinus TaxID=222816 RepID=UPI00062644BA|nr:uncharacterized protein C4orf22 homolog [Orussus abietinus]
MTVIGTQIDSDRRLLKFRSFEEYLDSLVTPVDLCNLRSTYTARQVAELGYRCAGETLDRESFERRLAAVRNLLFPVQRPYELSSECIVPTDRFFQELALRERPNRLGVISTIIFMRQLTKKQYEVSGYIDYASRLKEEDWAPFFGGKERLWPRPTDLSYYHWRLEKTLITESSNYQPVIDAKRGLLFKNVHDRKIVWVDPLAPSPGVDTTRVRVYSDDYEHIVLYDHVVRGKM